MRKIRSLIYILVLLAITGCGRKEVDYNITDEVVGNQEGNIGNLYEKLGAEDYWETQIYNGEEKYDIKASVTIPEVSSLNVYNATANIYSAEEREKLINYLTDDNHNVSEAQYDYMAYEHIIKHNNMDYVLRFRDSSPEYGAVEGGFEFGVSESYWWNDENAGGFVFGLYDIPY